MIVSGYIDDFLIASKDPRALEQLISALSNEYSVKDLGGKLLEI